ncbi:unnamed protein product [Brassicogethes aeneus]|uniref:Arrestin C-terminal-like domain-containing protein n=1 Tax=Brassicogethes aeneus TaxID=1431903 RepID=A0A9P0BFS6_BRAAE|nr:unnamed protein product [Brassicogethes aeneus]
MSCQILLDNYTGSYKTGDTIKGRFQVNLNSRKDIRGIKILIKCKERTEWTVDVLYTGNNEILYSELKVRGDGKIEAGQHTFPFTYFISPDLPSTYNGSYGSIYYYIKGVVDRPLKFDYKDKVYFSVFSPIDFNVLGGYLQEPKEAGDEKSVCSLCCAGGPVSCDVYLDKYAFVIGETINVKIKILNVSNVSVDGVRVNLTQRVTSSVNYPHSDSRYETDTIAENEHSALEACGAHEFVVSCELDGCHSDLDVEHFPKIGHIQLVNQPITEQLYTQPQPRQDEWEEVDVAVNIAEDVDGTIGKRSTSIPT